MTDGPRPTAGPGSGGPGAPASTTPAWSTDIPSIESVVVDGRRRIVYTGPSMNPTLREPDLLWVEPYGNRRVRVGDVVCFRSSEENVNIVHRVISVRPSSPVPSPSSLVPRPSCPIAIRTRGDNNPRPDIGVLASADLLGKVVAAQRGLRFRLVPGGRTGRMIACSVSLRKAIWRAVPGVGSGVYQRLVRSGPLEFLLPAGLRPRLVCFNRRGAATLKLLMGSRTVGHFDCRYNEWRIRRPFRLFVNQQTLPGPKSEVRSPESNVQPPESR